MKKDELLKQCISLIESKDFNVFDIAICTSKQDIVSYKTKNYTSYPDSYSVAKAFCVCAIGFLFDEGKIELNQKIVTYLKQSITYEYNHDWDKITVENCLTHHLGIKEACLDIDVEDPKNFGSDFLQYVLNQEFIHGVGEKYVYTDAAFYLISRIVYAITGLDIEAYLKIKLFEPLAIKNELWTKCPQGFSMGGTGLYMDSSDTVKLPALYLNKGIWKGQRLLSEKWMALLEEREYENYYSKVNGWRAKGGMLGQLIMYHKDYDCAVSWHGIGNFSDELRLFVLKIVNEQVID